MSDRIGSLRVLAAELLRARLSRAAHDITSRLLAVCLVMILVGCSDDSGKPRADVAAIVEEHSTDDTIPTIRANSLSPTCSSCTIELRPMFSIGHPLDSVFPPDGDIRIAEGADHRFYVAPLSVDQKIGQYDREGRLLAVFGGHVEEPGKYYTPAAIAASPDSMLLVLDRNQVIWYHLDSLTAEHAQLGDFPNQGGLLAFRKRRFVATSSGGMPGELLYSDPNPNGTQIGTSASPSTSRIDREAELRMWRVITGTDSTWFTASWRFEPLVEEWDRLGKRRRFVLPAPWYPRYDLRAAQAAMEGPNAPVLPVMRALWRDTQGLLWTITSIADRDLVADGSGARNQPTERDLLRGSTGGWRQADEDRFDAIVAAYAISDSSISLVSSARFDPLLVAFLSDTVLAGLSHPEPGLTQFTLFRIDLTGYPR